jgi:hypothetical protein
VGECNRALKIETQYAQMEISHALCFKIKRVAGDLWIATLTVY